MLSRRRFLTAGGLALAGLSAPAPVRGLLVGLRSGEEAPGPSPGSEPVEIRMRSDVLGSKVWFDPIGVWVEPGTTVRWVLEASVHSTTAYHPANAGHPLRIPEAAEPWDSGILTRPGETFEVTLTVPGIYDYYCIPHEAGGMVGRIVVGEPGDEARPFVGTAEAGAGDSRSVPEAARQAFPAVERIVREKMVRIAT
ncbi:MAG TPA: plastocyanin/azurin family copper-binding protein [Gemmatimonadota bacterium]|nr:plastocyanin/azurin family copper-binding protein [Gemmatimonadota bacterium]